MKEKIVLLLVGVMLLGSGYAFATTSITKSTYTAEVDFTGFEGVTSVDIVLRNRLTDEPTTLFTFTPEDGCLGGGTTWYTSNTYAVVYTTWTSGSPGRLLVYTNNKADDADPKYTGSGNPAGLVCSTGTVSAADPLELCWRVTDNSTTTVSILWKLVGEDMKLYAKGLADDYYVFLWMRDKDAVGADAGWYDNNTSYSTFKSLHDGNIQHAEDTWSSATSPEYFYLGCNFQKATAGRSYKTSTLRFDLVFD